MRNINLRTTLFILIWVIVANLSALSIDLPDSITFTAGESITESFADYITNNSGNPITLTCSGNENVSVNIHHGTDVDFTCDEAWSGTENITFSVTDGTDTATDDLDVIVTPAPIDLILELPDSITFTAGESITESFASYITNNTGNPITLTYSGNENISVNIHHGTDVDFTCDATWSGTETITFSVTDGTDTATDDLDVIVTPAPIDLILELPDSITFTAGESITESFASYITNNTGNPITLSCSGNENVSVNIHHGTDVDFTCDEAWSGTENITFSVTDGTDTATDDLDVIVTPAPADLIIELPDSITFTAGESITESFASYITNNTGNPITLACSGNENISVNIHHGTDVDFTCDATWSGTETITFSITDGTDTATDNLDVIVTPAPSDLIIELPDSITFTAGESITESFASYITNNTGNPITLTCSGNENISVNIHHGTDVDFTCDATWNGTETITFSVTDGTDTATDDLDVIVTPAPADLIIELPDSITFTAGESITESFASYITNNTGNPITLTCSGNENISVNIHHGTDVDFTCVETWSGTETITFSVTDGNETATDDIDVVVLPAGTELSMDLPDEISFERWTTIDVDFNQYIINNTGNELSLTFSGNENVIITVQNNLLVHLEGEPFWEGSELVNFVVSDGQGRIEAEDSVTITITPEPGDITIDLPDEITMITNTVREENLGAFVTSLYIFEFSWDLPEHLQIEMNDMNHAFFSVLVPDWSGSEDITFTVTDFYGNTDSDTVTLVVLPESNLELNLPSTFSFHENQTVTRDLTGFVNESDITFTTEGEDNVIIIINDMEISITPADNWTGTDTITMIAENSNGETSSDEVDIVVTEDFDNSMAYKGGSYDGFDFASGTISEFYLLSGVVVDSETFDRIAGAVITNGTEEAVSNDNGEYELYLESGTYTITCSADDYISQTEENFSLVENTVLNFQLDPDVSTDGIIEPVTDLQGNYPNPFNPVTYIEFSLAENTAVILEVYNVKGQLVRTLLHEFRSAGTYSVLWDGHDSENREVASGIYYYKMQTADFVQIRKMLLLK